MVTPKLNTYLFYLITGLALLSSASLAQNDLGPKPSYYGGGGAGLTLIIPTLHASFGVSDIPFQNAELRLAAEGSPLFPHVRVAADFLYVPVSADFLYSGAGPRLWFIDGTRGLAPSPDDGWYFDWSLGALGGLRFQSDFGHYYLELELSYLNREPLFGGPSPIASLRFGAAYDF